MHRFRALLLAASLALLPGAAPVERPLGPKDVQAWTDASGSSAWLGRHVVVHGVVAGVSPHGRFYYLCDPDGGPLSGLKVEGPALGLAIGDRLQVRGDVTEPFGETRLVESSRTSTGAEAAPAPTVVTVLDVVTGGESWEGVLLRVADVIVGAESEGFGEYPVNDATATGLLVDDEFFTSYVADPGDTFESITGLLAYSFGEFKIEPRSDDDLAGYESVLSFDGLVRFTITDESGAPLPSKATFTRAGGGTVILGPGDRAGGTEDVAYLALGEADVGIPSGTDDVVVSRGIEYGLHEERITVVPGVPAVVTATLVREIDTTGWISGDFHLHCAPSTDTALPVPGRIISLAAEGVEWAVATDHNQVTDYTPLIAELGLGAFLTSSIGDEISTRSPSYGHFNAWPLEPGSAPPPFRSLDPAELFAGARLDPGIEVVQVNHPSIPAWNNQYFDVYAVDPNTGEPQNSGFSFDFDALEVMNGRHVDEGLDNFSVWMRMRNGGHPITATGNSDSHHLVFAEPGYPRNYVAWSGAGPADAVESDLVDAVLAGRSFVTYGPFLDFTANDAGLGDLVSADAGEVRLAGRVRCASWLRATDVKFYANALEIASFPLAAAAPGPQDESVAFVHTPRIDTWYLLLADGTEDLAPVRRGFGFRPLAFTNPILVDVDGDGKFTPPGNFANPVDVAQLDAVDADGVPVQFGEWVAIEGCATTVSPFPDPSIGNFYLEDGTGGILVREDVQVTTTLGRGERVRAAGIVSNLLGETVLTNAIVESLGPGPACEPGLTLATGDLGPGAEALEGRVVRIAGVNVTSGTWPSGGAEGQVFVDDGTGDAPLYIPAGVVVPPEAGGLADFAVDVLVSQRDGSPPHTSGYRFVLRSGADLFGGSLPTSTGELGAPLETRLFAPEPSPFREAVRIRYSLRAQAPGAKLEIVDVTGRRVRALSLEPVAGAGTFLWDGRDGDGRIVASGLYFVRLVEGDTSRVEKIVKIR